MSQDWSNKTILVAEDEATNYLFIEKIIKPTQAILLRAENGSEAISIINSNKSVDLILMDLYMPEMDGFEASKKIRKIRPELPIIAQTFFEGQIEDGKIEGAAFNAIIRKPININKLLVVLEKYLQ